MNRTIRLIGCAAWLLALLYGGLAVARAQETVETERGEQTKSRIQKIGVGTDVRVKLLLKSGKRIEGHVGEIGEEHFYVVRTDSEKGVASIVAFTDVVELKTSGNGGLWRNLIYRSGMGAGVMVALLKQLRSVGQILIPRLTDEPH